MKIFKLPIFQLSISLLCAHTQLWIYTVPAGVAALLTAVAYWWNKPPLPPTLTSEDDLSPNFFKGLRMVRQTATTYMYIASHFFSFLGGFSIFFPYFLSLGSVLCLSVDVD